MNPLNDGLRHVLSGMGGPADRQAMAAYAASPSSPAHWRGLYEGSSLAQKIVEIPAFDATRSWRAWQTSPDHALSLSAVEARLDLRAKVRAALISARLYGSAALYAGDGGAPDAPLSGPIQGLRVIAADQLSAAAARITDLADPNYGRPAYMELRGADGGTLRLHPGRLAMFYGLERPVDERADERAYGREGAGLSALTPVQGPLKALDAALHNAAALTHKMLIDTLKIPELTQALGAGQEAAVAARLETFNLGLSVHRLAALDDAETLERHEVSFAGLSPLLREFQQLVAAAADIPFTRLMGRAPGGMNATGASDIRNYYDRVRAIQELQISTALKEFDQWIAQEALNTAPPQHTWRPLWQETAGEKAKTALDMSSALARAVEAGLVSEDKAATTFQQSLNEAGLG